MIVLGVLAIVVSVPRWNENDPDGTAQLLGRGGTVGGVVAVGVGIAVAALRVRRSGTRS